MTLQDAGVAGAHRVVVIGAGFGGLFATRQLRHAAVECTVIDRTSHHLFQPLLYQVATGILSEGEIAQPIREVLRHQHNARFVLGEVTRIDIENRIVESSAFGGTTLTPYDSLIVAAGSCHSHFGNDTFAQFAPGMKSIDDGLLLRRRIFDAFEAAELEADDDARTAWLTFVVVGGGPTGVEMAGQLVELSRHTLKHNYSRIDPASAQVILVEASLGVLTQYGRRLSERALIDLRRQGVDVRLSTTVVGMNDACVELQTSDGQSSVIPARTRIWAAGVTASPLGLDLAASSGTAVTRSGQVPVGPDCSLPGHPEVFVIGDMMKLNNLPGVAQVAIQSGRFAAQTITARISGSPTDRVFNYRNKGSVATISRFRAVGKIGPLQVWGAPAWGLWLAIHLFYLVGFKNRVTVVMHWLVTFVANGRSERVAPVDNDHPDYAIPVNPGFR